MYCLQEEQEEATIHLKKYVY